MFDAVECVLEILKSYAVTDHKEIEKKCSTMLIYLKYIKIGNILLDITTTKMNKLSKLNFFLFCYPLIIAKSKKKQFFQGKKNLEHILTSSEILTSPFC